MWKRFWNYAQELVVELDSGARSAAVSAPGPRAGSGTALVAGSGNALELYLVLGWAWLGQ